MDGNKNCEKNATVELFNLFGETYKEILTPHYVSIKPTFLQRKHRSYKKLTSMHDTVTTMA